MVDAIRTPWLLDVAQVITDIGSTPVILGCSGIYAGAYYAKDASLARAAGAGLLIALASTGLLVSLLSIQRVVWTTRR